MSRLLTRADTDGNVTVDVGKTLAGLVIGALLVIVAVYLWSSNQQDNGSVVWTFAVTVITGTLGIVVGEKTTGGTS